MRPLRVEFCGEWYTVDAGEPFTIGRESDLTIDDNPYLHRTFLTLSAEFGLWWLSNVGQLLSATVSDATGSVQAWVAPGAKLPLVFQTVHVMFSAGSTTYDFTVHAEEDFYNTSLTAEPAENSAELNRSLQCLTRRQRVQRTRSTSKISNRTGSKTSSGSWPTGSEIGDDLRGQAEPEEMGDGQADA